MDSFKKFFDEKLADRCNFLVLEKISVLVKKAIHMLSFGIRLK